MKKLCKEARISLLQTSYDAGWLWRNLPVTLNSLDLIHMEYKEREKYMRALEDEGVELCAG